MYLSRNLLCVSHLAILACLCVTFIEAHYVNGEQVNELDRANTSLSLPKLFDFEYYKSVFKKSYSSLREEIVRRKIVLAKALRAFVSGIAYKYKRSRFYLALNVRSDRTPEEIARSNSKIRPFVNVGADHVDESLERVQQVDAEEPDLVDDKEVTEELNKVAINAGQSSNRALKTIAEEVKEAREEIHHRSKRSNDDSPVRGDFTFDSLVKRPARFKKRYDRIESNNPDYEPPEITSMGAELPKEPSMSGEVVEELLSLEHKPDDTHIGGLASTLVSWLTAKLAPESHVLGSGTRRKTAHSDVRFVDHSQSECMVEVGDQGDCGSCYAFSLTAVYAWLICKQTGKLAPLSEQYLIDCAAETEYKKDVEGCVGGYPQDAGGFFEKYGVELARNYPYFEKEGKCPYEDKSNYTSMGYIRLNKGAGKPIWTRYKHFDEQLEYTPLIVTIGTGGSFWDYGGGIFDGQNCCKAEGNACGVHVVVVVGHGSEDGEDYWIIRNSVSTAYGENGYIRMSKNADCIWPKWGLIFAFDKKSKTVNIVPRKNRYRPEEIESKIKDATRYE